MGFGEEVFFRLLWGGGAADVDGEGGVAEEAACSRGRRISW